MNKYKAGLEINSLLVKLKDASFPIEWEEKVRMSTDPSFKVKRYVVKYGT